MTALRDILGMEIGSINWRIRPTRPHPDVREGGPRADIHDRQAQDGPVPAHHLPGGHVQPGDWYRPAGQQRVELRHATRPVSTNQVADFTRDLLLKIKYIEWGRQRDPFFLKVGNLEDITIGHGLIMRNFANDADFPAVRHMGVNIGLDGAGCGFEAMVNDVAPDIVNGSFSRRTSSAAAVHPAHPGLPGRPRLLRPRGLEPRAGFRDPAHSGTWRTGRRGRPDLHQPGVDLDLPFVETRLLRARSPSPTARS